MTQEAMLSFWILSGASLVSVACMLFSKSINRAIQWLWLAQMTCAGVFLSLGQEFLFLGQLLVGTLTGVCNLYHSYVFSPARRDVLGIKLLVGTLVSGGLYVGMWLGIRGHVWMVENPSPQLGSLKHLGTILIQEHFVSSLLMILCFFCGILGLGLMSRPEARFERSAK